MQLNNQNGFTLVQAIFIMVVLALLGTYMVSLSTVQQSTTTQAVLQARAYQAARAGLEWGIKSVTDNSSCFSPTPDNFLLEGYFVVVKCDDKGEYNEGGTSPFPHVYHLTSTASYPAADALSSPDYVSRTLEVTIHD